MKTSFLHLFLLFSSTTLFAQNLNSYAFNSEIITNNQPSSVKEYLYGYYTQIPALVQNHTLNYNSNGLLVEHVRSNEGISNFYQTFRDRFEYDSKSRLIYHWDEQKLFSGYSSQREQQWVYDNQDMITEVSFWSVVNGTKNIGSDSYKRVITRDNDNKVLKIEKSIYTYSFDDSKYELVLDQEFTFKYDADNVLDSIIVFARNITLGGVMKLNSKQFDFNFKNYSATNIDLLVYNSYQTSNYDGVKRNIVNTFDTQDRILTTTETYASDDELINKTTWTYETDKITKTDLYERKITYIDVSGISWKTENYSYNGTDWELDEVPFEMYERTFDNDRIVSDLHKSYYDTETETYKNDTRYDYEYSTIITGILAQQASNGVVIYPNPSAGIVYVNGVENIQKLSIASINGTSMSLPLLEQIDLSALAAGVYIVTVEYNNQTTDIQRLIVK